MKQYPFIYEPIEFIDDLLNLCEPLFIFINDHILFIIIILYIIASLTKTSKKILNINKQVFNLTIKATESVPGILTLNVISFSIIYLILRMFSTF
jgi:hypothetical protein